MTEEEKQQKLKEAKRILDEINEAEKNDYRYNWRPWVIGRIGDHRS